MTTQTTETTAAATTEWETSYSALEHTITVEGGWPVCAECGEQGAHEQCQPEQLATGPERDAHEAGDGRGAWVPFDRETARAWLPGEDPDEPDQIRSHRYDASCSMG